MKYKLSYYIDAQGILCVQLNNESAYPVEGVKPYTINRDKQQYKLIFI